MYNPELMQQYLAPIHTLPEDVTSVICFKRSSINKLL